MSGRRLRPNTIKDVTPFIVTNPRGIDVVARDLQAEFTLRLDWLEKSFARAVVRSEQRKVSDDNENVEEYIYPAVFVAEGKDYLNMLELDNWSAYSFFVARDPEEVIDFGEGIRNTFERTLNAIFWMNLELVDPDRKDDFLEGLKRDIIKVITDAVFTVVGNQGTTLGVEIETIFDEPVNIFEGFSIELEKSQLLYYPYRGLRFQLNCTYVDECIDS